MLQELHTVINIEIFDLPTLNSSVHKIEEKFCELNKRYRNGEALDEVEITWLDQANTFLQTL